MGNVFRKRVQDVRGIERGKCACGECEVEQLVAIVAVCRLATPLTPLMAHRVREQVKVQVQRNGKMKTWGGSRTQRRIY